MSKIKIAVIGVGYLGKFHAQKYAQLDNSELVAVVDLDQTQGEAIAKQNNCRYVADYKTIVDEIDGVCIAAPTRFHFDIAEFFLKNNKHVLVEKPMTVTLEEADILVESAKKKALVLQVGHLERFNPAILSAQDKIKNALFIESHRLAPFNPRGADVNVILDLMIHDIDIILAMIDSPIKSIHAKGIPVMMDSHDIASARIEFESGCVANVTASRVSTKSERKMRFFQKDTCITIDFQNKTATIDEKDHENVEFDYPTIKKTAEQCANNDAILEEAIDFLQSIECHTQPKVNGEEGKKALDVALQITALLA